MAFNFFTSFYTALSNPNAYSSFQKEMNLKAVEQVFFNSMSGKTTFNAVVLQESVGNITPSTNGSRAIRVRPLDIHDFILPEPCNFSGADRQKVIMMHPVAFPDTNFKQPGGDQTGPIGIPTGHIVECFFGEGPQGGGRLRGLSYRPKIIAESSNINLDCLQGGDSAGEAKTAFDEGTPKSLADFVSDDSFVGPPVPSDLKSLAKKIGLTERILKAIRIVESRGNSKAIRFEPHIFLSYRGDLKKEIPYTPHSNKIATDYTATHTDEAAFLNAFKFDGPAAIKSTSFGLYQVVLKYADLSISTNQVIKNAVKDQESATEFLKLFNSNPILVSDELLVSWFSANKKVARFAKQKKWKEFALRYNGKECCGPSSVNKYDEKLKKAYDSLG